MPGINRIALIAILGTAGTCHAKDATDPRMDAAVTELKALLSNFHFVSAGAAHFTAVPDPLHFGVYRGAVPIAGKISSPAEATPDLQNKMNQGVKALAERLGVKTIVDLETSGALREAEAKAAQAAHVSFVSIELPPIIAKPTRQRVEKILKILSDRDSYPLYVHCRHGQDRTGTVVGLYRYFIEGLPPEDALEEMKAYGFHSIDDSIWEAGYECYFREVTGLKEPWLCSLIPSYDPDRSAASAPAVNP
jgi:hypothetical protein